jgi:hypothetical protein
MPRLPLRANPNRLRFALSAQGGRTVYFALGLSLILAGFALVGVFIFIPFVSTYAFWILIAAYVILAAGRAGRGD